MPGVGITTRTSVVYPTGNPYAIGRAPHVTLTSTFGSVTLDITAPETEFEPTRTDWVEVKRPGRRPFLVPVGDTLSRMSIQSVIGVHPDGDGLGEWRDVGPVLVTLCRLARPVGGLKVARITVAYSPHESDRDLNAGGNWLIEALRYRAGRRRPSDNAIVRAEVDITLVEGAILERIAAPTDPTTGGTVTPNVPLSKAMAVTSRTATAASTAAAQLAAAVPVGGLPSRYVTAGSGDTLYSIAAAYYGNGDLWRALGDANGITDPRTVEPGTLITLGPRTRRRR